MSGETRTVIVQPKYKGAPIWKWVGKRFAAIAYFDAGTLVVGAELLEAGVLLFVGPFMVAFAHVERQTAAFAARDASAIETEGGDVKQAPSRSDESATRQGDAQS